MVPSYHQLISGKTKTKTKTKKYARIYCLLHRDRIKGNHQIHFWRCRCFLPAAAIAHCCEGYQNIGVKAYSAREKEKQTLWNTKTTGGKGRCNRHESRTSGSIILASREPSDQVRRQSCFQLQLRAEGTTKVADM